MKTKIILGLLAVILFTSCGSSKVVLGPNADINNFNQMSYLGSKVNVGYINKKNNIEPSDSINALAQAAFDEYFEKNNIPARFYCVDTVPNIDVENVMKAFDTAYNSRITEGAYLDKNYLNLAESSNNYVVFFSLRGFTRRSGNYAGQIAKGIGIGLLTSLVGASVTPTPIKHRTLLSMYILDKTNNEIVYCTAANLEEEPTKEEGISKCFENIMKQFNNDLKNLRK